MRGALLFFLILLLGMPLQAQPIPKGFVVVETYESGDCQTILKVYGAQKNPYDGKLHFRVYVKGQKNKDGFFLYEDEGDLWSKISDDGEGIVINNRAGSDFGLIAAIFKRNKDGTYRRCGKEIQAYDILGKMSATYPELKKLDNMDHSYCYGEVWLTPHRLLGSVEGHLCSIPRHTYGLDKCWFIYDTDTDTVSFDLNPMNKKSIRGALADLKEKPDSPVKTKK